MSDFDKEAEREKLREKYGDDADSESTEQMSELLLKGATMTNAHCDNCGDPIFRYDDQEFCPTCQQPVDRGAAEESEAEGGDNIEVTAPSDDATVQFGGQSADAAGENGQNRPAQSAQTGAQAHQQTESETGTTRAADAAQQEPTQPRPAPSVDPAATASAGESARTDATTTGSSAREHLTNAQVLLAQTVEQYAQRAQETESPREAQEYLEAAREAAATLDETGF